MKEITLAKNIQKIISEFIKSLQAVYGHNLISVILYGSAASGEYTRRHSNVNVAVVLSDTTLNTLARISRILRMRKFLMINPVFFTEDYIARSTDVFPIEFMDMKENHIVLYGKDVLKDIAIDMKNLRFQCEQELKSKIINTKRIYLRTTNKFLLKKFLFKTITSSIHILRNLIRLKGKTPPYAKEEVLNEIAREFSLDIMPLQKILDAKNKNIRLSRKELAGLFTSLVGTLEAISDKVDRI